MLPRGKFREEGGITDIAQSTKWCGGSAAVLKEGELVGILTVSDLLAALEMPVDQAQEALPSTVASKENA